MERGSGCALSRERGNHGCGGEREGALRVAITQVAEQGKANKASIAFLSKRLGIARSRLELVSEARTVEKIILVHDISETELRRRIGAIVG